MECDVFLRFYNGTTMFMNLEEYERDKIEMVVNGKMGNEKKQIPEGYKFRNHFWTHDVYVKEWPLRVCLIYLDILLFYIII